MADNKIRTCGCCRDQRKNNRRRPRLLEQLPVLTPKRHVAVFACEHCDGPVVELASRAKRTKDLNLDASTRPEDE